MSGRSVQVVVAICFMAMLAACGTLNRRPIDRPLYYDVRDVAVMANGQVPQSVVVGVDRRIREALYATARPEPRPRVVLTVTLEDYGPVGLFGNRRNGVSFKVVATSVDSGMDVAAGGYTVLSATDVPGIAEESLAEEIAARVRYAFSLATPRVSSPIPQFGPYGSRPTIEYRAPSSPFEPRMERRPFAPVAAPLGRQLPEADAEPAARASSPRPVQPVETIMPKLDRPLGPVPTPRPPKPDAPAAKPSTGSDAAGTNIEQGANASIKLGAPAAAPPPASAAPLPPAAACDPARDTNCKPGG